MDRPPLIVIGGPTASGKSACAVELCRIIQGEVVSADSMQLYQGMDIGTAKPDQAEMGGIPHHLLSIAPPTQRFSAAAFAQLAHKAMGEIRARGKMPVLCGGTGLYINAVTRPMGFAQNQGDEALRSQLEARAADEEGRRALHEELRAIDPKTAGRLHPNDIRRVIRALEVYQLTGKTMSELAEEDQRRPDLYKTAFFALDFPREVLYERIDRRVDEMMRRGLEDEVRALLRDGLSEDCTAMQALGYKEMVWAIRGEISMERAVELIKQGSRNYAKRQLTWFRRDARVQWIGANGRSARDVAEEMARRARQAGVLED